MNDLQEVTLDTVAQGSAPERFQHEWNQLLENIQDPNTDPEVVREVTIRVKVKPSGDRDSAALSLEVKSKLAPAAPVADLIYMGRKDGELVAIARDPRQPGLFDKEEDANDVLPIARGKEQEDAG